jgi:hypothetical protein
MDQHIPHKPDWLSQDDHDFILQRDGHRCALYGKCPHSQGRAYCDEQLDFDHEQPRELGGDNSFANVRLLCASHNRGRKLEPVQQWSESKCFDRATVPAELREVQRLAVWDAIEDLRPILSQTHDLRSKLLGTTTLLPGATGTGKCILAVSAFFRFNQIVGVNHPRVRHVLWLTVDTTLRDTGATELEDDGFEIGFLSSRPTVQRATSFADINQGPNGSDIKIAAVQSVWVVELADKTLRHDDTAIRKALSKYDTIVFDECDWGNDQVRNIARLGSHALQFSLTATPPISEIMGNANTAKEFLKRFVMITPTAIADYTRAVELDQCLKLIGDEVAVVAGKHDSYASRERGELKDHTGRMEPDHPVFVGTVLDAVISADHLETRMREISPESWYSPHIMVRMRRVADLKAMFADLNEQLENLYQNGVIKNLGWKASMVYQGHAREKMVEPNEYDLAAKKRNGNWRHPFMMARNNNGRAMDGSKRILLMCQIGVRGINNWTILYVVDCTDITTMTELIQFDEGRPLRWKDREDWLDPKAPLAEFATTRVFIPTSDFQREKIEALMKAHDFMRNMKPRMEEIGFMTWADLIQGRSTADAPVNIDPSNRALTDAEKFQVQELLAKAMVATGSLTEDLIGPALAQKFNHVNDRLRERLTDYAKRLVEKPEFRQHEMAATDLITGFKERPANVMDRLYPQDQYDKEDLIRWVKTDSGYEGIRDEYLQELEAGKRIAIHSVSQRLRAVQVANYRPAARTRRLQGHGDKKTKEGRGVLPEVAADLIGKLRDADQLCEIREIERAINGAANMIFQIEAKEGGPMDHPAYHIAILGRYREKLQSLARARLISDGILGQHLQRMANL